jgi:8-hydroxy-5-deazaflavin:NADPH oxidoreductase
MEVTIIGAGNMAGGIGTRLVAGGNSLTILARDAADAQSLAGELNGARPQAAHGAHLAPDAIRDTVVVLALPYGAVDDVLKEVGPALEGRVVVDITNPLNASYDGLVTPHGSSAAEQIQRQLGPAARVVKAFNTTFANTLVAGQVAGEPLDVFIAGDDADAKGQVAQLVRDGGLNPVDVGPLQRARQLEQLALLGITLQQPLGLGFGSSWKLHTPDETSR